MVDVAGKAVTERVAVAEGYVVMERGTLRLIEEGDAPKGDVLAAARIAGIMAAKRTSDLHSALPSPGPDKGEVDFELSPDTPCVRVEAMAKALGQTGVEMEALTAVSVSLPHALRHAESAGQGDAYRGHSPLVQDGRQIRRLPRSSLWIARGSHDFDAGGRGAGRHCERRRASGRRNGLDLRGGWPHPRGRPERETDATAVRRVGHGRLCRSRWPISRLIPSCLEGDRQIRRGAWFRTARLRAGEAVRIFTGAPVPAGADTIVIQENTKAADDGAVEILESASLGQYVRPQRL